MAWFFRPRRRRYSYAPRRRASFFSRFRFRRRRY